MKLHFEKADENNRKALEALRLFPQQKGFIETVEDCLKEADEDDRWEPVGIYDGDDLIGFSMYGAFGKEDRRIWLDRIMIDKNYQGKGCGKEAVIELMQHLKEKYSTDKIYLSVFDDNVKAITLYKELGFTYTGELDYGGEKVMVCGV